MTSRAHLHELARKLRRYLAWQKAQGVDHYVPAGDEEREEFEARKQAHREAQLADLRSEITDDDRTEQSEPGGPLQSPEPKPTRSTDETKQPGGADDEAGTPTAPSTDDADGRRQAFEQAVESAESSDERQFDPTDTSDPAEQEAEVGEVTSSTPLWKRHDSIRELTGGEGGQAADSASSDSPQPRASATPEETPERGDETDDAPKTPAEKMAYLQDYLGDCTRCPLHENRTNIVFGDGDPEARLMFVGEGPGRHEDNQGLPFVGRSGQLLTKMIEAMGLTRQDVYITNVVKCRPPGNRNPAPGEIRECSPFLRKQVEVIEPVVIVTLGKFASNTLLDEDSALGDLRGRWHEYRDVPVMPTYHPAYLLRNEDDPRFKRRSWSDLQMAMERLGLDG